MYIGGPIVTGLATYSRTCCPEKALESIQQRSSVDRKLESASVPHHMLSSKLVAHSAGVYSSAGRAGSAAVSSASVSPPARCSSVVVSSSTTRADSSSAFASSAARSRALHRYPHPLLRQAAYLSIRGPESWEFHPTRRWFLIVCSSIELCCSLLVRCESG